MSTNDQTDAPTGEFHDESYVSRSGRKHEPIPVVSDGERIEKYSDDQNVDSDEQLGRLHHVHSIRLPHRPTVPK